jgi:ribose 5-phosphate isomerase A
VSLGGSPKLRLKLDGSPYLTDNGNEILDCNFRKIADPPALARELSGTPGVVEHGLFIGLAKLVVVGRGASVEQIRPKLARKRVQTKRVRTKRPSRKRQTKSR